MAIRRQPSTTESLTESLTEILTEGAHEAWSTRPALRKIVGLNHAAAACLEEVI